MENTTEARNPTELKSLDDFLQEEGMVNEARAGAIAKMNAQLREVKPAAEREIVAGTEVLVDDGFSCIEPYSLRTIEDSESGLYFSCACGKHMIDGQLEKDAEGVSRYVGIYLRIR